MNTERQETFFASVVGAGLIAGLRSLSAPAAVSAALSGQSALAAQLAPALRALAAGEMFVDKLPFMPARTSPVALAGRVLLGAPAGAAVLGSFVGLALRSSVARRLSLPDPLVALVEDVVVVVAGRALVGAGSPAPALEARAGSSALA